MKRLGVPKEIEAYDYRVGSTPTNIRYILGCGHQVEVEAGAGFGIDR